MSHRPMYSSQVSGYQMNLRSAFENMFIAAGVDVYLAGHIHWYERMWPMSANLSIDTSSIIDRNTYQTNTGVSMKHLVNGMAGNIESHSTLGSHPVLDITNTLNMKDFGFSTLTVHNASTLSWAFIKGDGSGLGDTSTLHERKGN